MGQITNDLINKRDILISEKAFVQGYDMTATNTKITKLNNLIQKITEGGWDL